jgi:hypothetical protein
VVTTPSGGQVLAGQGLLQHQRPGLVGPRQASSASTSRWTAAATGAPARLQTPVMDKCLTRFNLDWAWDGKPALVQSRATDDTGYVQPSYKQLRAVRGTPLDLSQQRRSSPGWCKKTARCECPAFLSSRCGSRWSPLRLRRAGHRREVRRATRHRPRATPKEVAGLGHRRAPRLQGPAAGSGTVAQGQDVWEQKCAGCHGVFGESNEVFSPIVGGTTADDIKTGRVAGLNDNASRAAPR